MKQISQGTCPAMDCPLCQTSNPPTAARCTKCDTPLPVAGGVATLTETPPDLHGATVVDEKTTPPEAPDRTIVDKAPSTMNVPTGWSAPAPQPADAIAASLANLRPGSVFGNRYEILRQLGQGGMGAVYQARDRELDRLVAMKVIRPELATRPDILQRFKQELILARQVTHRNVIRIFDLGEADGIKFITMEFIEGQDLKTLVAEKGKPSIEETVSILEQVCLALEAAHSEGVVHRDLKPQNIMVDKQGKVSVMDFGIARSIEFGGMTQTGALIGTPEYMSPEQVQGEKADARSDLFTLGIIFYELLTGVLPYQADTVMGTMIKRTKERARPPAQLNPQLPQFLSDVVAKCLEADPQKRYQSAREIYDDLKAWQAGAARRALHPVVRWLRYAPRYQKWVAASVIIFLLTSGGYAVRQKLPFKLSLNSGAHVEPVSLAILPFRNASGDRAMDWLGPSLAEMLRSDVGQSASLRTVSPDRVHQILKDLRLPPNSEFDPGTLGRLAEFTNAQTLVWGQYLKVGDQIRIDATVQDRKRQRTIPVKAQAPSEKELLQAIAQLAQSIQQNLSLSSDLLKELRAKSFQPSSGSIQALRHYNEGLQSRRQGKNLDAARSFEAAIREDPEFALAYSKLGQTYADLGYDDKAEQFSRKAVELSEKLPEQERYLIQANHARIANDTAKAIESYENLAKVQPEDLEVHFNLGGLYESTGALDKARAEYAKVLARDPKQVDALLAAGRVEIKRGNPQRALEDLNPALSLAIQLENDEEKAAVLQAIGVAYKRLNKLDDALRNYQESLEIKRRLGQKRGIAASLNEIAQIQGRLGKPEAARANFNEALQLRREIGDKKGIGDTLNDLGYFYTDRNNYDQALKLFKEALQIQREVGNEKYQALCLSNIGLSYLSKGDYEDARTYFEQALQMRERFRVPGDIADTLHNLAETFTNMGQYDQALAQYLRALELRRSAGDRRGAAIESYSMGTLFEYQGRYGAALGSKEEALKAFRELQDRSFWMAEILSGYGHSLSQVGHNAEAQKSFDEALSLAREIKSQALVAQTLGFQGDAFFYRADFRAARLLFEQALQEASRTTDRHLVLLSKLNLARVAVEEGHSQTAINSLRALAQEADSLGLKYLSTESSIYLAEALMNTRQYPAARQELDAALRKSEKLGLKALLARSHYLLGRTLKLSGNAAEATGHLAEARRIADAIRQEAHTDDISKRSDLSPIYAGPTG
jgi:eukaryotic-like serine/threonine-protein kinase